MLPDMANNLLSTALTTCSQSFENISIHRIGFGLWRLVLCLSLSQPRSELWRSARCVGSSEPTRPILHLAVLFTDRIISVSPGDWRRVIRLPNFLWSREDTLHLHSGATDWIKRRGDVWSGRGELYFEIEEIWPVQWHALQVYCKLPYYLSLWSG